jgi:hypothetical protein
MEEVRTLVYGVALLPKLQDPDIDMARRKK